MSLRIWVVLIVFVLLIAGIWGLAARLAAVVPADRPWERADAINAGLGLTTIAGRVLAGGRTHGYPVEPWQRDRDSPAVVFPVPGVLD